MEIDLSNFGRIGVLMGGPSSEREISFSSGRAVYESLKGKSLDVVAIDIHTDDWQE
ncbi:MAG: D-alanine--D-alanine ligase, partial [Candidatus Omnitrophota bacterium]